MCGPSRNGINLKDLTWQFEILNQVIFGLNRVFSPSGFIVAYSVFGLVLHRPSPVLAMSLQVTGFRK